MCKIAEVWTNRMFWRSWLRMWKAQHFTNVLTYTTTVDLYRKKMGLEPEIDGDLIWEQKYFDLKLYKIYRVSGGTVSGNRVW